MAERIAGGNGSSEAGLLPLPEDLLRQVQADVKLAGGELVPEPDRKGSIGSTMFDLPGSEDNSVTVLLPRDSAQRAPSQSLVRIKSRDGRAYLGIVTAGPFAEPDTLRADSHLLIAVTAQGGIYLPPYHGRVQVAILGEELRNGSLVPPRLRPLPNSPVVPLTEKEVAAVLGTAGDIRLGTLVGASEVPIYVPSDRKSVLPRHLAILGTTGGGKSTTVSRLIEQAQTANMAVILLDVEGEYTHLHEPTDNAKMLEALAERGMKPKGVPVEQMRLYHLVGRDTTNPRHPHRAEFSLQFAQLSPYAVAEMLGMTDAQEDRFRYAYDVAKVVLRDVGVCPEKGKSKEDVEKQEKLLMRVDEFERGWPRMTLSFLLDVVGKCLAVVNKAPFEAYNAELRAETGRAALEKHIKPKDMPANALSWGKLKSLLWRLNRLKVFDRHLAGRRGARPLAYRELLEPGRVSVVDLSDTGMAELANFAIADLLRGIQGAQEAAYRRYEAAQRTGAAHTAPPRVLLILEEAHEFLSAERIDRMDTLFQQLARIAKRGRKRWLSLAFVTQLPQHLPRQIYGLVNSYILHKISDVQVVRELRQTVSGIDDSLWQRLSGLAPGQAIVSFPHLTRPLLVAIDPAPCRLRMVD